MMSNVPLTITVKRRAYGVAATVDGKEFEEGK